MCYFWRAENQSDGADSDRKDAGRVVVEDRDLVRAKFNELTLSGHEQAPKDLCTIAPDSYSLDGARRS